MSDPLPHRHSSSAVVTVQCTPTQASQLVHTVIRTRMCIPMQDTLLRRTTSSSHQEHRVAAIWLPHQSSTTSFHYIHILMRCGSTSTRTIKPARPPRKRPPYRPIATDRTCQHPLLLRTRSAVPHSPASARVLQAHPFPTIRSKRRILGTGMSGINLSLSRCRI